MHFFLWFLKNINHSYFEVPFVFHCLNRFWNFFSCLFSFVFSQIILPLCLTTSCLLFAKHSLCKNCRFYLLSECFSISLWGWYGVPWGLIALIKSRIKLVQSWFLALISTLQSTLFVFLEFEPLDLLIETFGSSLSLALK